MFPFWVRVMVFNATCNNISVISWQSVLLVEETGELKRKKSIFDTCKFKKKTTNTVMRVVMVVIVWQLVLQLPVLSVPITTNIVSSNLDQGEVYSIQHYVIKFVSDLWQVGGFLLSSPVSSTNKTDCHDITEILLQVALNTITLTQKGNIILTHVY